MSSETVIWKKNNQYFFIGTIILPPRWMELSPHEYKVVERNVVHQLIENNLHGEENYDKQKLRNVNHNDGVNINIDIWCKHAMYGKDIKWAFVYHTECDRYCCYRWNIC